MAVMGLGFAAQQARARQPIPVHIFDAALPYQFLKACRVNVPFAGIASIVGQHLLGSRDFHARSWMLLRASNMVQALGCHGERLHPDQHAVQPKGEYCPCDGSDYDGNQRSAGRARWIGGSCEAIAPARCDE
jgi:hypothetical protein